MADTTILPNAFVTLLNSSSYLPGALVLCHALNDLHPQPREVDFQTVCIVTPETVDVGSIKQLRQVFDLVIGVEVITSGTEGQDDLDLMGRPDLHSALTKLHIFRLAKHFRKIVYLDADVLPLRPISQLFQLPEHFYASPDIGWPDCFNSGVMVFTPRQEDFDGMMGLMKAAREGEATEGLGIGSGNGSFDGADQGLLNEWFSEEGGGGDWHRLSFTYNATPSATYTYLPAYRRYGSKINCVHFIGNNKPWRSITTRPARAPVPTDREQGFDYPALVDKWFAVYDKHLRPMGETVQTQTFSVPENVAIWNRPALSTVEGRADLHDMHKSYNAKKRVSFREGTASNDNSPATHLSGYISLPLEGRIDLMRPQPVPEVGKPDKEPRDAPLPSASASPPFASQVLPSQAPSNPQRHSSPPAVWDARVSAPPQRSGAEYGEMRGASFNHYENAWDKPLGQHEENDWNPVNSYPVIPDSVKEDRWYAGATDVAPDRNKVKDVFPWEQGSRRAPARRFPKGDTPPPASIAVPALAVHNPTPPDQTPAEEYRRASQSGDNDFFGVSKPSQTRQMSFADAMRSGSYKNAWDSVPAIDDYVARHGGRQSASAMAGAMTPALKTMTRTHPTENPYGVPLVAGEQQGRRGNKGKQLDDMIDRRSETSRDGDDEDTESSAEEAHDTSKRPIKLRQGPAGTAEPATRQSHSRRHSGTSESQGRRSGAKVETKPLHAQAELLESGASQVPPLSTSTSAYGQRPAYSRDLYGSSSIPSDVTPIASRRTSSETLISSPLPAASSVGLAAIMTPTLPGESARHIGKMHSGGQETGYSNVGSTAGLSDAGAAAPRRAGRVFDPATDIDMRRKDTLDALARGMKRMGSNATP
ncbi:hypothetical protein QFC22_003103 [Naganishia vaughanmartiniae]|uniref:Uncharacterized protein n=1 Tax=Naganishia vaughanmartiniae TaxID=1424756 RepID=A0ACC2X852_9TREE|nr:hypothetical protein QFC22_003103 [Naganishia vaughanmartiniae]